MPSTWHPITDSDASLRLWEVVEEIERSLVERLDAGSSFPELARNPRLSSGKAGVALFFAYLDAARPGTGADERAFDLLGDCIDSLGEQLLSPSLYSGFAGIGWMIEHLTREVFEADDDLTEPVDALLRGMLVDPRVKPFEMLTGIAGFGIYLLERLPHPNAAELLPRVLDQLEAAAERSPAGCTWFTRPEWLPDSERQRRPQGCYSLGVAHGMPGVIGFLAAAQHAGIADPRIPQLAEASIRWLLDRRLEDKSSVFPALIVPGTPPEPTRTAWCYGDLGIACVLLSAARSFGRPDWEEEALALARLSALRSVEATGTVDSGLCHGAAGLAHLFLRIHHATGDPAMKEAALAWFERTLGMRQPGEGVAGFLSWLAELGVGEWRGETGLLSGAAGVGLALLAAVSHVEPAWDRVMLVSLPPNGDVAS